MTNRFETRVTAKDEFSKVFKNLDDLASKASGSAMSLASSLGKLSGPATALAGIGSAGILGTPAALTALTVRWADMGSQTNRQARSMGVSADEMQRWAGAAKLANVPAETMIETISRLGETLQNLRYNMGSPEQSGAMSIFGLKVPVKNGVVDQLKFLEELARVMQPMKDPHAASHLAEIFGIVDPRMVDFLRQGADAVAELRKQVAPLGGVQGKAALDWADKLTEAMNRLDLAMGGVSNRLASLTAPGLVEYLNDLARTIANPTAPPESFMRDLKAGRYKNIFGETVYPPSTPEERRSSGKVVNSSGSDWRDAGQKARDEEAMRIVREEMANPNTTAAERQILQEELNRRGIRGDPLAGVERNGTARVGLPSQSIDITFHGLPPGVTASASAASGATVRVERAMPQR